MTVGEDINDWLDRQDGASDCRKGMDPRFGMSLAYYAGYSIEYANQEAKAALGVEYDRATTH